MELICQDARPWITLLSTTGFAIGELRKDQRSKCEDFENVTAQLSPWFEIKFRTLKKSEKISSLSGLLWIGLLSNFVSNWRILYTGVVAPGFITVIYFWWVIWDWSLIFPSFSCMTESPYWLASHDKTQDIKEYCKNANKLVMVFDWRVLIFDLFQNEWDECQLQGMYWGEGKTGRTSRSIQVIKIMIFDLLES